MGTAKLLDCTLRDGAYLIDKNFGDSVIRGIVNGLVCAKVDFIELGFLQNEGFGPGKTVFRSCADARKFIPEHRGSSRFALLADCSRYSVCNLDAYEPGSVDAVRECFFKHERDKAMENCREIKKKGYLVFVQPVDILGYSEQELVELVECVNRVEPYALSIVDTFGSMFEEDLMRVFRIIDSHLISSCRIGFHSHNNMQLSNALSQSFIRTATASRDVIVDGTISGMGRGAGNTPTELIAQYMVSKLGYDYHMDALLDIIDGYMDNIRSRCSWGYSTPMFLAGCYSSHVNNVSYLMRKSSIRSKDIRFILNKMDADERKRYPYEIVEQTYLDYLQSDFDDSACLLELQQKFRGRNVVVIAPGRTASAFADQIRSFAEAKNALVVTVNFVHDSILADFVYMSNAKRYQFWHKEPSFVEAGKILTSNVVSPDSCRPGEYVVSFMRLVKCGWEHLDNSTILLLRLLDKLDAAGIFLAGLDGYSDDARKQTNYAASYLELSNVKENPVELNSEIYDMLVDYRKTRNGCAELGFITPSRFEKALENENE